MITDDIHRPVTGEKRHVRPGGGQWPAVNRLSLGTDGGEGPLHGLVLRGRREQWTLTWGRQWYPPGHSSAESGKGGGDAGGACEEAGEGWAEQSRTAGASQSHRHAAEEGERVGRRGGPAGLRQPSVKRDKGSTCPTDLTIMRPPGPEVEQFRSQGGGGGQSEWEGRTYSQAGAEASPASFAGTVREVGR